MNFLLTTSYRVREKSVCTYLHFPWLLTGTVQRSLLNFFFAISRMCVRVTVCVCVHQLMLSYNSGAHVFVVTLDARQPTKSTKSTIRRRRLPPPPPPQYQSCVRCMQARIVCISKRHMTRTTEHNEKSKFSCFSHLLAWLYAAASKLDFYPMGIVTCDRDS